MNRIARRQRAALALFIALTVSGVGVALAAPQTGDQPTVTLDVLSPNDGQNLPSPSTVTVAGAGFPINTSGVIVQSAALPNGTTAVSGTLGTFTSSASGTFTSTATVSRTFVDAGSGQTIDCNTPGIVCYVEAFTTSGNANSRHTITFAGSPTTVTPTTVTPTTVTPTTVTPTTVTPTTVTPTTVTPTTVTPTTVTPTTVTPTTVTPTTVTPTTVTPTTVTPTTVTPTTVTPTTVTPTTVTPTTVTPTTVTPTTVAPTTTIVGPTTTIVVGTQCAQIRVARAQLNAQIDAARNQILQSGLSPQQQAVYLAQLEAVRAQGNAQLDALLAGCPAP